MGGEGCSWAGVVVAMLAEDASSANQVTPGRPPCTCPRPRRRCETRQFLPGALVRMDQVPQKGSAPELEGVRTSSVRQGMVVLSETRSIIAGPGLLSGSRLQEECR